MDLAGIEEAVAIAERRWPGYRFEIVGDEAHGPCPICGKATEDGFIIWDNGYFWCRPGGCSGWLNDDQQLSKQEIRLRKIEAEQRRAARERRELERRMSALERMAQCSDHLTYHKLLDDDDREYWTGEGVWDENVDKWKLGICYNCPTDKEHRPSYTLPIWRHNKQWLWNIVHRLVGETSDKYRPHVAGLGKQLVRSWALEDASEAIIVEGGKKAKICSQYGFNAVGLQGCSGTFPMEWVEWMGHLDRVWIAFDPDALDHADKLGSGLAKVLGAKVRVCHFPVKPDDLFARYSGKREDFRSYLELGRLM